VGIVLHATQKKLHQRMFKSRKNKGAKKQQTVLTTWDDDRPVTVEKAEAEAEDITWDEIQKEVEKQVAENPPSPPAIAEEMRHKSSDDEVMVVENVLSSDEEEHLAKKTSQEGVDSLLDKLRKRSMDNGSTVLPKRVHRDPDEFIPFDQSDTRRFVDMDVDTEKPVVIESDVSDPDQEESEDEFLRFERSQLMKGAHGDHLDFDSLDERRVKRAKKHVSIEHPEGVAGYKTAPQLVPRRSKKNLLSLDELIESLDEKIAVSESNAIQDREELQIVEEMMAKQQSEIDTLESDFQHINLYHTEVLVAQAEIEKRLPFLTMNSEETTSISKRIHSLLAMNPANSGNK
jgi:hypothetical protein